MQLLGEIDGTPTNLTRTTGVTLEMAWVVSLESVLAHQYGGWGTLAARGTGLFV